jgi:predicted lipoprotein with Yx(FWY)xxD motif
VMLGVTMISGQFRNLTAGQVSTPLVPQPSITVQDQTIHNGTIVISQVVSIGDAWLVIHPRNPDGTTGDYIGYAQVKNGINTNVLVKIDVRRATQTLFAMLHVNASKAASPQFPGVDEPVMVGGQMFLPPFRINGALTGDIPITVAKSSSGAAYLADNWGTSLYISVGDTPGKNNCAGDCPNTFRPLLATGRIVPGSGLSADKLGVIALKDGTRQVTYSGSPLYYYVNDKKPGDTLGQGMNGLWFLATP